MAGFSVGPSPPDDLKSPLAPVTGRGDFSVRGELGVGSVGAPAGVPRARSETTGAVGDLAELFAEALAEEPVGIIFEITVLLHARTPSARTLASARGAAIGVALPAPDLSVMAGLDLCPLLAAQRTTTTTKPKHARAAH